MFVQVILHPRRLVVSLLAGLLCAAACQQPRDRSTDDDDDGGSTTTPAVACAAACTAVAEACPDAEPFPECAEWCAMDFQNLHSACHSKLYEALSCVRLGVSCVDDLAMFDCDAEYAAVSGCVEDNNCSGPAPVHGDSCEPSSEACPNDALGTTCVCSSAEKTWGCCPMALPQQWAACDGFRDRCAYDDLTCFCSQDGWTCGVCPGTQPSAGSLCETQYLSCYYAAGTCNCANGSWTCF